MTRAWLRLLRDEIVRALVIDADQCGVLVAGEFPPGGCGETFVSVEDGEVKQRLREGLLSQATLDVGIWIRVEPFPEDRRGDAMVGAEPYEQACDALEAIESKLIRALHGEDRWVKSPNDEGTLAKDTPFLPLFYTGREGTRLVWKRQGDGQGRTAPRSGPRRSAERCVLRI